MKQKNIVAEFLGLPGVGKTTLSNRVSEIIFQRGMSVNPTGYSTSKGFRSCIRMLQVLLFIIGFAISSPRYSFLSFSAIIKSKQKSKGDLSTALLNWFVMSSRIYQYRNANGIRLLDQGIFQALWTIGFGSKKPDPVFIMGRLHKLIPTPHMVVVVEANLSTIERRMSNRLIHISRIEERLPDDPNLLVKALALLQEIKETVNRISEKRKDMRVLIIDNDRDEALETNARKIADAIQNYNLMMQENIKKMSMQEMF